MNQKNYSLKKKFSHARALCALTCCLGTGLNAMAQTVVEAETFENGVYATIADNANYSGGKYLSLRGAAGSVVEYTVNVAEAGAYDITFTYVTEDPRYISIQVDDQVAIPFLFTDVLGENSWGGANGTKDMTTQIYLKAGNNTLRLGGYLTWSPNVDKFKIEKSSIAFSKPDNQITPIVLEAEDADVITGGSGSDDEFKNFSGGKGAGGHADNGFKIEFAEVNVPTAGAYDIYVYYASTEERSFYVKSGDRKRNVIRVTEKTSGWGNDDHNDETAPAVFKIPTTIYMDAGKNKLTIGAQRGWTPNIDKIEVVKSGKQIADPGIEILSSIFDFTDLATLSDNATNLKDNLENIRDNNEHTLYTISGSEVKVVAELPYPIVLTGFAYATDVEDPAGNGWFVEYSEDGVEWFFATSINPKNENGFYNFLTGQKPDNNAVPAKFFRLNAKGAGTVKVGEWQLYGVPYVSSAQQFPDDLIEMANGIPVGTLTASDQGFNSGGFDETVGNVLDKKFDTKYTVTGKRSGVWLTYEFLNFAKVESYSLTVPYSDNYPGRNPKSWRLSGLPADGDGETWVELDVRTEITFPAKGSTLRMNIEKPMECIGYRLDIDATANDNDIHLSQWQLFGDATGLTTISSVEAENLLKVYGGVNQITLYSEADANYSVYDITGKLIKTGVAQVGNTEVTVAAGLYIVHANGSSSKVIVR